MWAGTEQIQKIRLKTIDKNFPIGGELVVWDGWVLPRLLLLVWSESTRFSVNQGSTLFNNHKMCS